jgi:hypothetical protein
MNMFKKIKSRFHMAVTAAALIIVPIVPIVPILSPPTAQAQTPFLRDGLTGEPYVPILKVFTNALAGVGGLHTTNGLTQLTNGSTTVTSAWVKLGGRGATLWQELSPTNALLTNIVSEWRFSRDGVNPSTDPVFLWRTPNTAIAAGKATYHTNLAQSYVGEVGYIQLWKVHLTNGVNNVGSVFATNNQAFFLQRGS